MATQMTMQAMGPTRHDSTKMIGGLPSPTLTNPDMVLPNEPIRHYAFSPSRNAWRERPPSPSYLRDTPPQSVRERSSSGGSSMATPKKEKRGLMSRKMMLLRSRTASNNSGPGIKSRSGSVPSDETFDNFDGAYGSSPTLMDVGNLAPEQPEDRRVSGAGSSPGSDEISGLPQFLAKYDIKDSSGTEDELEDESPASQRYGNSATIESGLDAHRRQQEEDEHNSAILSKRAEQILANAKKRLNLMEGNLRGARDLVQPLTAANLKRATSVGSYASPVGVYGIRARYVQDGYSYEASAQQKQQRKLQAQASSPTIGKDYQGHYRGYSETSGLPDRPHTSLERTNTPIGATPRLPTKVSEPSWNNGLRSSRSHDSLGSHAMRQTLSREPSYTRGSPDPNLGALVEEEGHERSFAPPQSRFSDRRDSQGTHDGLSRSSSRTDDVRDQMTSLKAKISTLKERAREDSKRRQSMQNLREPSPLNNASVTPPEFFYTSAQTYGSPVLDTNAGIGWSAPNYSPDQNQITQAWEPQQVLTGSPNAFAEQAPKDQQQRNDESWRYRATEDQPQPPSLHKRTPSGRVIVQSSKHRLSHHQQTHSRNPSDEISYNQNPRGEVGVARGGEPQDDAVSQYEASVYEDAKTEQPPPVVAHEDREDALDYQQFWLQTAMGGRYNTERRDSVSSEDSESSIETARGPTRPAAQDGDGDDELDQEEEDFPPASPETPERLREIEKTLHKRTFSDESVSTVATFATATEGRGSPDETIKRSSPPSRSLPRSAPNSRPATAIPIKRPSPTGIAASDSSSERADSGVGLPHRSHSSQSIKRSPLKSATTNNAFSPPMSPRAFADPATVAVNAMLNPTARQLGLKEKALLFSLVESLRSVCHQLQERSEADFESRALRRRLDDARKILNGAMS